MPDHTQQHEHVDLVDVTNIHQFYADPHNRVQMQFPTPENQYTWQHMSRFYPTAEILRSGAVFELKKHLDNSIEHIKFPFKGTLKTVEEHLDTAPIDAFIVIKQGELVFERYNSMRPIDKHNWFSNAKATTGVLLAMFIHEGLIIADHSVSEYLHELKGTAWDSVTVQHTADMCTGLDSTEHDEPQHDSRTNPEQGWFKWAASIDLVAGQQSLSPLEVVATMQRRQDPGQSFEYNSINTFVLSRIIERVSGKSLNELFSERFWQKMGASADAYVAVSKNEGYPLHFFSVNSNLEDMARFGVALTPSAKRMPNGQFVADGVIKLMQNAGDTKAYGKGYVGQKFMQSFSEDRNLRNGFQWDAIFEDGDLFKGGVGGQGLYVSPTKDVVIAWFSTGDGTHQEETMARYIAKSVSLIKF
ncbi:serine hydrolase domain-containing protein [Shewanella gaetbuli]|uniref:Beta-lactamase family protein n=1 Tax=Shewanella gaetbuli TaxID=220752 RepID=A0A9X2CHN0_9GAMM|nr:serine hydrolase domain-containing protein [Shewanella gaetbuli]MCL1142187.1 beta-lactamase family protein [Shewanella gaetbuli]